ncbi:hypothetical protein H0H92_010233 [Tricholoma furcatifolium]|nr:hypothetical protein H0H92_010233 [Tricholoma furcatifolium]
MVRIRNLKHLKHILTRTAAPVIPSSRRFRPLSVMPSHDLGSFSDSTSISHPTSLAPLVLGVHSTRYVVPYLSVDASQATLPLGEPMCIDAEDVDMLDMTDTSINMEDPSPYSPKIQRQHGRCLSLPFPITAATTITEIPVQKPSAPIFPKSYLPLPRLPTVYDNIDASLNASTEWPSSEVFSELHEEGSLPVPSLFPVIEKQASLPFAELPPQPLAYQQSLTSIRYSPQPQWMVSKTKPTVLRPKSPRMLPYCQIQSRTWHSGLKSNREEEVPLVHQDSCRGVKRLLSLVFQTVPAMVASAPILLHVANGALNTSLTATKLFITSIKGIAKIFDRTSAYFEKGEPVILPAFSDLEEEDAKEEAEVLLQLLS